MTRRTRTRPALAVLGAAGLLVLAGCADPSTPASSTGSATGAGPTVTVTETQTESASTGASSTSAEPSSEEPTSEGPSEAPSGSGLDSPNLEKSLEAALEAYLEFRIEEVLAENGVTLSKGPTCNADLTRKPGSITASGKVSCTGTTTKGLKVSATFRGSVTAGASCDGQLVVKVGGQTVVNESLDTCIIEVA